MISTKNLILDGSSVPSTWVFEFYLDLPERLNGQNVKLKSIFHPTERTPSMWVFVDKGQYKFKDFSTGKGGNKIDLVKEIFNFDYSKAVFKITQDYNKFITDKGEYLGADYVQFIAPLMKAVQELSEKVESQQKEIEDLKNK